MYFDYVLVDTDCYSVGIYIKNSLLRQAAFFMPVGQSGEKTGR